MPDGIYDGHRGGYSSKYDTFSTWKNNTSGLYNEYRIDGSWLNDGDYDKAFKGFPSHKTVNIFMGGTAYEEPSIGTTLLSGGIGLGITALGMWAMGLFGRGKAKADQPSTALNLGTQSYWNRFFNNWNLPSLYGSQTPSDTPAPSSNNQTQQTQQTPNAQQAPATDKTKGLALNSTLTYNTAIQGEVTQIGMNNAQGYPESFKVTDTTYSNDMPNIYTYNFVAMNGNNPQYQIGNIEYFSEKDKTDDISPNTYTITNGAVKKGKQGEAGKVDNEIKMSTTSNKPAMHNPSETGKGTKHTYPPKTKKA